MFTIGDFARHGRVSVRMLRHYDAIGLLRPAHVDRSSGYRFYQAAQLARLNRIVALKELGFTLQQVSSMLDEKVSADELRGMLRLRHAELRAQLAADTARLGHVEARLRIIESEGTMTSHDVVVKHLPATRIAELTATAGGFEPTEISPVIQPLYVELCERLDRAGVPMAGHAIAYYEPAPDGTVIVHAGVTVNAETADGQDFAIVDLPATDAATLVHRGSMDGCMPSWQALASWLDEHGHRSTGPAREFYLATPDDEPDNWVTELQEPIAAAG